MSVCVVAHPCLSRMYVCLCMVVNMPPKSDPRFHEISRHLKDVRVCVDMCVRVYGRVIVYACMCKCTYVRAHV